LHSQADRPPSRGADKTETVASTGTPPTSNTDLSVKSQTGTQSGIKNRILSDLDPAGHDKPKLPGADEPWQNVPAALLVNNTSSIEVSIAPAENRKVFRAGEKMRFLVKTSEPGYLYLIVFSQKNQASVIFPNRKDSNNKVSAGPVTLPRNSSYSFPVGEPFGKDLVVALVSSKPLEFGDRVWHRWKEIFDAVHDPKLRTSVNRIYADQATLAARGISVDDDEIRDAKKKGIDVSYTVEIVDWQGATLPIESKRQ
jgi:hypothetical protein